MKQLLLKYINGEPEEYTKIVLLLGLGFSMGIFLSTYQVAGDTLFLSAFNAEADLPLAKIFTGISGAISAVIFAYFQKHYPFKYVSLATLLVIGLIVTLISFQVADADLSSTSLKASKHIIFVAFILSGPLQAIVVLIFWSLFGRLFNLRASKRLAGGIDTGTALATIIGFFTIPIAQPFIGHIGNFFFVSSVSVLSTFFIAVILVRRFELTDSVPSLSVDAPSRRRHSSHIFKNRYLRLMSVFLVASVVAAIFMDYTFKIVVQQQYAGNENNLASFLSFFEGFVMICSFIIQSFFNDKILDVYGLRVTLLILPGLLFLFNIAIVVIGWVFGVDPQNTMFLLFFLIIAISKLLTDALRDSLENPTFKMFFLPLPTSIRFDVQTQIEGSVKEFAAFIAGALMIVLELIGFIDVFQFIFFMFLIIAIWAFAALRMHSEYKLVLERILGSNKLKKQSAAANNFMISRYLENSLWEGDEVKQRFVIRFLERTDPMLCERLLCQFTKLTPSGQRVALRVIQEENFFDAIREVEHCAERSLYKDIRDLARQTLNKLKEGKRNAGNYSHLEALATSPVAANRRLAAQIISQNYHPKSLKLLIPLLRDWDRETRIEAINSCGQLEIMEPLPILVDHLSIVGYENVAISAIVKYGEKALPLLDLEFFNTGQSQNTMIDIIRIYGFIGGAEAVKLLVRKFDFPDNKIRKEVLYSLNRCGWRAEGAMTAFVRSFLEKELENTVWNLAALDEIPDEPYCIPLKNALQEEINNNFEEIFLQLALLYDAQSVALVKENLEAGTTESVGYALELADAFVDDSLKAKLLPVLDDISIQEKIKRLESFFIRDEYGPDEVLLQIINRDYNYTSRWAKACAIYAMRHRPNSSVIDDIVACLFNPDELLREISAWYIVSLDPKLFEGYVQRIDPIEGRRIARVAYQTTEADYDASQCVLMFEKVLFLQRVKLFKHISAESLTLFSESIEVRRLKNGQPVFDDHQDHLLPIYIIRQGEVSVSTAQGETITFRSGDTLSDMFNMSFEYHTAQIEAVGEVVLFKLDADRFLEDLTDSYELTDQVLENAIGLSRKPMDSLIVSR